MVLSERVRLMDPRAECLDNASITPLRLPFDYVSSRVQLDPELVGDESLHVASDNGCGAASQPSAPEREERDDIKSKDSFGGFHAKNARTNRRINHT